MSGSECFQRAIAAFDAANAEDPNVEIQEGHERPKELVYAERMSAWLDRLYPDAGEPLRLAARCQHIRRWAIPRDDYPRDRVGYLKWRTALKAYHADCAGEILREAGYDEPTVARVQSLVKKERLKRDAEAQRLEDVVCLVFLENYFADFSEQHDEDKIVDILRKTWAKMSPHGQKAALDLALPVRAGALVERALASAEG